MEDPFQDPFPYKPHHYILDEHGNPVLVNTGDWKRDLLTWGEWYETADRRLAQTLVDEDAPRLRVSTVFLGLDHNHWDEGPPILWETMIFPGEEAPVIKEYDYQERYSSRAAALKGHARAVNVARRFLQELDAKNAAKERG